MQSMDRVWEILKARVHTGTAERLLSALYHEARFYPLFYQEGSIGIQSLLFQEVLVKMAVKKKKRQRFHKHTCRDDYEHRLKQQ